MKIRVFERFGKKKAEEIRDEIFLCEHEGVFIYFLDRKDEIDDFTDKIRHRFLFRIVNFTKQEVTVQMENPYINCKTVTDYTMSTTIHKLSQGYAEASVYMEEPIHDGSFVELNFIIYHQDYDHDTRNIGKKQCRLVMNESYPLVSGTFVDRDVMESEEFIRMVDKYIPHKCNFTLPNNVAPYIDLILETLDGEPVILNPEEDKEE